MKSYLPGPIMIIFLLFELFILIISWGDKGFLLCLKTVGPFAGWIDGNILIAIMVAVIYCILKFFTLLEKYDNWRKRS